MCHWCGDETNMLLAVVPGLGFFLAWLRARFHHKKKHQDCDE